MSAGGVTHSAREANQLAKDVTQTQQQRPQPPTVTPTFHAGKYKVHINSHLSYGKYKVHRNSLPYG